MSQEALDLRRSIQTIRRHKLLMGIMIAVGVVGAVAYAVLNPPMVTSTALVLLPETQAAQTGAEAAANGGANPYTATQQVIAKSNSVLIGALPHARPAMSLSQLRSAVAVGSQTAYIISVSATAKTGVDAAADANAVAESYIRDIGSPSNGVHANLLQRATSDTGPSLLKRIIMFVLFGLLGAIVGAAVGAIIALAFNRRDRRLRERDEIANSIGIPVLASFPVGHPSDAREWTRLLENYKPGALHALQLRRTLQQLEMAAAEADFSRRAGSNGRWSFTVLSLSTDPVALALGPQLATFAASQGIPTMLVIAAQSDATVTASLRAACATPPTSPDWPRHLQPLVSDADELAEGDATLAVVVGVIDSQNPRVPGAMRTTTTLLGVSAGAASADQLARAAVSVVSDGREITGILVANPDSADATTGHLPQLGRRGIRRMPTRMTGIATEIRR